MRGLAGRALRAPIFLNYNGKANPTTETLTNKIKQCASEFRVPNLMFIEFA